MSYATPEPYFSQFLPQLKTALAAVGLDLAQYPVRCVYINEESDRPCCIIKAPGGKDWIMVDYAPDNLFSVLVRQPNGAFMCYGTTSGRGFPPSGVEEACCKVVHTIAKSMLPSKQSTKAVVWSAVLQSISAS